jgi:gas vesicle protein
MSRDDSGSNVIFFLLGAAVGAAAGVLLAPKSGEETREQLADWLHERRERSAEVLHKLKEKESELLHKIKDVLPEKKEQVAAAIKAGKQAFYEAKHNHQEG